MKTLKDKIIDEGKRILVSSIPFAIFTKRGSKIMNKDNKNWGEGEGGGPPFTAKNKAYITLGVGSVIAGVLGIFIAGGSIHKAYQNKTPDYRKWPEIKEQRREEQIFQRNNYEQRILNKAYNFFDLNQDGSISRKEFEEGIEKVPKDVGYNTDFYDRLNWDLNLDEKHVKAVRE